MQMMVQMDDTNPCVQPQTLCSPGAAVPSSATQAEWESWLRQGCPGMGHREEEHDGKTSVPLHLRVLWIADQDSWEVKLHTPYSKWPHSAPSAIGGAGPHLHRSLLRQGRGEGGELKRSGARSRCGRKHAYLPWLMTECEQVFFTKVRKTKIHLNAFLRQPVVSPYPTGTGLDFLGVTTKAGLPARAVEMYSWMYQLCVQKWAAWSKLWCHVWHSQYRLWETCFVPGWGDTRGMYSGSQSTLHLPKYSEGFKALLFCLHYVVWRFSGWACSWGGQGL